MGYRELDHLVGEAYDCALGSAFWQGTPSYITDYIDVKEAAIFTVTDGEYMSDFLCGRLSGSIHADHLEGFVDLNEQMNRLLPFQGDMVLTGSDFLGESERDDCPVHESYIASIDIPHQIVLSLNYNERKERELCT